MRVAREAPWRLRIDPTHIALRVALGAALLAGAACSQAIVPRDASPEAAADAGTPCVTPTEVRCGDRCESDTDRNPDHCGPSCRVCPAPTDPGASRVCVAGACGVACAPGSRMQGDRCVACMTADACGAACAPCATRPGTTATCAPDGCHYACAAGMADCDGDPMTGCEVVLATDPGHCGACATTCPAASHGAATCAGGACGVRCDPGFELQGGMCIAPPPRPLFPPSTQTITSRRPRFRWRLPAGQDGATVEICADRACTRLVVTLTTTGDAAMPASDLPAGVLFWRVRGRVGGATVTDPSATWEFTLGRGTATVGAAWGTLFDPNGDGLAEAVVSSCAWIGACTDAAITVAPGGSAGPNAAAARVLRGPAGVHFGADLSPLGDINGDGFADLGVIDGRGTVYLYLGGASGLTTTAQTRMGVRGTADFARDIAGVGDIDGDGYGDVAVGRSGAGDVVVFRGDPTGLAAAPTWTLTPPGDVATRIDAVYAPGDVDGDGRPDLVVTQGGTMRAIAYLYLGAPSGFSARPAQAWEIPGGPTGGSTGAAGDVNGDGYPDVALYGIRTTQLFLSSARGPGAMPVWSEVSPSTELERMTGGPARDVDGDGFDDLVVVPRSTDESMVEIVFGGADVTAPRTQRVRPPLSVFSGAYGKEPAYGPGDVDGDGLADVLVGIPDHQLVYYYRGTSSGLPGMPTATVMGGSDFGILLARGDAPHGPGPRGVTPRSATARSAHVGSLRASQSEVDRIAVARRTCGRRARRGNPFACPIRLLRFREGELLGFLLT